jgi:hypothetical protein
MVARTYHKRGELIDGVPPRKHPSYNSWSGMLARCFDTKRPNYKDYGGKGITVCEQWFHFKNFVLDMGIKPQGKSLDRIDNSKGYELANCRWADRKTQNSNKGTYRTSKTGMSGVRIRGTKFQVRVIVDGKRTSIGQFESLEKACLAKMNYVKG